MAEQETLKIDAAGEGEPTSTLGDPSKTLTSETLTDPKPNLPRASGQILVGRQFGRYEIKKELGQGAMGAVYLALDSALDRDVALKIPKFGPDDGPEDVERFYREARAMATLHHPNLCAVYDVGECNGTHYLSMAYIAGASLQDYLKDGKSHPSRQAASVLRKIALALDEAHQVGVVHRDLKPANIMIDKKGEPVIMDFGLARRQKENETTLTQAGQILGTPAYMAPEQVEGDHGKVGPQSDVYALGVICYEMITGRRPFQGTLSAVMVQIMTREPEMPSSVSRKKIDSGLEQICLKAMSKKRENRYQSAGALAKALRDYLKCKPGNELEKMKGPARMLQAKPLPADLAADTAVSTGVEMEALADDFFAGGVASEKGATVQVAKATLVESAPQLPVVAQSMSAKAHARAKSSAPKRLADLVWNNRRNRIIALASSGGLLLLLGVIILLLPGKNGTVRIEINDPEIEVTVGESGYTIKGAAEDEITLSAGEHLLAVKRGDFEFKTDTFMLNKGETVILKVEYIKGEIKVKNGNDVIAARAIPKPPSTLAPDTTPEEAITPAQEPQPPTNTTPAEPPQQPQVAQEPADQVQRLIYINHIQSAQREWETNNPVAAWTHLKACREELRGWEYGYLYSLFSRNNQTLEGHTGWVFCAAYSPDGRRVVSGSQDGTLKVWDTRTAKPISTLAGHDHMVFAAAFSPDGGRIVSGGRGDEKLRVWDANSGKQTMALKGHTDDVWSVAFSPDGSRVASSSDDGTIKLWDPGTGEATLTIDAKTRSFKVAFSPNGRKIVSSNLRGTLELWDARTGEQLLTLSGHTDYTTSVAFSPDGGQIVSGSQDHTLKVWDATTGKEMSTLKGHGGPVTAVAFSPDGSRIASGSDDQTIKLWDTMTAKEALTLRGHSYAVSSVSFSPDGQQLASSAGKNYAGELKLWEVARKDHSSPEMKHTSGVTAVAFSPDGSRIASGGWDNTIRLWDTNTLEQALTINLRGKGDLILALTFSANGNQIINGSRDYETHDQTIKVWGTRTGKEAMILKNPPLELVSSLALSPDGKTILSGSWDGRPDKAESTLRMWDANTGEETLTIGGSAGDAPVAFSPDSRMFVSRSGGSLKLWNADTGKETMTFGGHRENITGVAFSPDGTCIASGSWDKTIKLWDARTGNEKLALVGHTEHVNAFAFSPDGSRIVSAGEDRTVKLWDALTGVEMLTLKGHRGPVTAVSFSRDGSRIVSGSDDTTLKLWEASVGTSPSP